MKNLLFLLVGLLINTHLSAQSKNEDLYNAIQAKDKNQVTAAIMGSASVDYVKSISRFNKTNMLISAVKIGDSEIVKILVDHNANIEWKDGYGRTALMYACALNKLPIVQVLLESGANVNANDGKEYNVLVAAKSSSNDEIVSLIEEKIEALKEKKKE